MKKLLVVLVVSSFMLVSGCIYISTHKDCGSVKPCDSRGSVVISEVKAVKEGSMTSTDQKQAFMAIARRGAQQGYTEAQWSYLIGSLEDSSLTSTDQKEVLMYIIENKTLIGTQDNIPAEKKE